MNSSGGQKITLFHLESKPSAKLSTAKLQFIGINLPKCHLFDNEKLYVKLINLPLKFKNPYNNLAT